MSIGKKLIKGTFITLAVSIAASFGAIGYMVNIENPEFEPSAPPSMSASQIDDMGFEQAYESSPHKFIMRDGAELFSQRFANSSDLTVVVVHGVLSNSYTYNRFAGLVHEAANAEVFTLDLRGHGQSSGTPGDIEYINQYVDDIADVIAAIKKDKPNGKIVLAGHSMGGGISLRYAMNKQTPSVDGYLLVAPLLGDNSPTVTVKVHSDEGAPFLKVHVPRVIGLALLNTVGIERFNDLPTLFFNLPKGFPLTEYSFRSSASMAPTDYTAGLQAIDKPMLVIVGENDEAFAVEEFKPAISTYSEGELLLVEGQTHGGIRHSEVAMQGVKGWIDSQFMNQVQLSSRD